MKLLTIKLLWALEAWTVPTDGDEEPCEQRMVSSEEFSDREDAERWAWERMEEGFFVRMWKR
jgi:hypothetical protein